MDIYVTTYVSQQFPECTLILLRSISLYSGCLRYSVPFLRLVQHIPFGLPRVSPDTPVCSYPRDPDHCEQRLQPPLMQSVHWRPAVGAVHRFPVSSKKKQVGLVSF